MRIDRLTMPGFSRALAQTPVAVLPVGSVEEHGAHLPLAADTLQIWEVARRAVETEPALLCPPVAYGYCRSTRDHPGTLSIRPGTLRRVVFDIGESLYRQGVRGLIVASGHAGGLHMAALEEAGERLIETFPGLEVAVVCEYDWAREAGRAGLVETPDDGHAGEIETSRILAIDPDLVRGTSPEEYPRFDRPFLVRDKRSRWPGGVWGNPGLASADKGRELLEASARRMARLIRRMRERLESNRV